MIRYHRIDTWVVVHERSDGATELSIWDTKARATADMMRIAAEHRGRSDEREAVDIRCRR